MGRRTVAAAMAVVMIGAVLAGCEGDSESGASPTVAASSDVRPSATPTPTLTPSPTPSEDALFLEAKEVHLRYLEQFVALEKAGGSEMLPESMKVLVAGDAEAGLQNLFTLIHERGIIASANSSWRRVSAAPSPVKAGYLVAITSCVDFRGMSYSEKATGRTTKGSLRMDNFQFVRNGRSLVIVDGSSKRVQKCAE